MDAGSNNWNDKEGNCQHEIGRRRRREKENKTLGTARCKNIDIYVFSNDNYSFMILFQTESSTIRKINMYSCNIPVTIYQANPIY